MYAVSVILSLRLILFTSFSWNTLMLFISLTSARLRLPWSLALRFGGYGLPSGYVTIGYWIKVVGGID